MAIKRKILILCDYWSPVASANSICVSAILKELSKQFEVVIISATCPPRESWPPGVSFVQVGDIGIRRVLEETSGNAIAELAVKMVYKPVAALNAARFPVRSHEWARRFERSAEKVIDQENVAFVICVSYPAETVLAGERIAAKHPEVPVVLWLLDATAVGMYRASGFLKTISKASSCAFERRAISRVSGALFLSPAKGIADKVHGAACLKARFADPPFINGGLTRFEWIVSDRPVRVLYAGTLAAPDRDPSAFIEAMLPLHEAGGVELAFAGDSGGFLERFGDAVLKLGILEPTACEQEIASADILLSIGNQDPYLIPSKLFKYISSGKPIIHIQRGEGDCCLPYLERYPLGLVVDDGDIASLRETVSGFLERLASTEAFAFEAAKLFPQATPSYTVEALVGIAALDKSKNERY